MLGSSKSVTVVQREMGSASTVFGEGLLPVLIWGGGLDRLCLRSHMPIQLRRPSE